MRIAIAVLTCSLLSCAFEAARGEETERLEEVARHALRRAVGYYRTDISTEGGYLWRYSENLKQREGEVRATDTMVWVQPPGTPSVGDAYLTAYEATGDAYYLEAARETAMALVNGQLYSGGWDYRIEFDPQHRGEYAYRTDGNKSGRRNVTTLDDNTTQAAVRLLMRVDETLDFSDEVIHEAALYALAHLVRAQYPNGAWPQRFAEPHDEDDVLLEAASYPESWSREFRKNSYMRHYTLNDNVLQHMVDTMLEAARVYDDPQYREAAERGGDFIVLAQLPEPQPAWAQQYDANMYPAWARKFEPPAVTGGESQGVMRTLLTLYRATGEERFLEPLPAAIDYFRRSQLANGQLARFYELRTNRPLFFTKDYQLTYDDSDMPTHYGFKSGNAIDAIAAEYERLVNATGSKPQQTDTQPADKLNTELIDKTKAVINSLDDRGRWIEDGQMRQPNEKRPVTRIIMSRTFCRNVDVLCDYLTAERED
jgi:PelA/Pel-15E family pectate lyase